MKIIVFSSNTSWYIYNFRKNTILNLLQKGYQVHTIAPIDDYSNELEKLGCKHHSVFIDSTGTNLINDFKTINQYHKLFKKIKPSVSLHFTSKVNIYANFAARLNGTPVINNISGLGKVFTKQNLLTDLVKFLYKQSLSKSKHVFFQNEHDKDFFIKKKMVKSSLSSRLKGSGVDLKRFSIRHENNSDEIRFLLIGRLLEEKGVRHYAEASKILKSKTNKNVVFRLIGSIEKNVGNAITQNEINVWQTNGLIDYLGFSDQIENEMAKIDCVVLPSYYAEGVPKSLLEAGAMGKPIITTDHPGCRDTVDEGVNGYLIKPKSTESLVQNMLKFISLNKEERKQMGSNSHKKMAKEFDEQINIRKYMEVIERII